MEKSPMCRLCLAENIHTPVVLNKNLQELYEKLTDNPIVTEDRILVCFICCAQLKQCYRLMTQCLKAEKHYAKMRSENYQPDQLVTQDHFESFSGLVRTPIESINIVGTGLTGRNVVKEELPAVSAVLDDIIEPKEEHQSEEVQQEIKESGYSDEEYKLLEPHHYENYAEDDISIEVKNEMEEVSKLNRQRMETNNDLSSRHFKKPRKRTRLSRQTATAKRLKLLRRNKTVDENMHRLATHRNQ